MTPSNIRYMALLDSATSAYSEKRRPHEKNWWLPNEKQRTNAMIFGSTAVMYRLLCGDVLRLPRNQVFDSPVFYNIFEGLRNVQQSWLTVSVLTKNKPTPLEFVKEVADQFRNKNFFLSAWPGLDTKQRKEIYKNLKRTGNFTEMLHGIGDLPDPYDDIFLRQGELLQQMLEYLQKNPGTLHKSSGSKKSLWDRLLDKNIMNQLGNDAEKIRSIPEKIKKKENINNRGVLYKYLTEYEDVRDTIREIIDQQYHYILAESVAYGRIDLAQGLFSFEDTLAQQVRAGDMQYDDRGIRSIYLHSAENNCEKNLSSLNWNDIELVLNDNDFQQRLYQFRYDLSICEGEKVREVIMNHKSFLEDFIPKKVIFETDDSSLTFGCVYIDRNRQEKMIKIISSFFGPISGTFDVIMEREFNRLIKAKVQKQRYILAGRIRDWLQSINEGE